MMVATFMNLNARPEEQEELQLHKLPNSAKRQVPAALLGLQPQLQRNLGPMVSSLKDWHQRSYLELWWACSSYAIFRLTHLRDLCTASTVTVGTFGVLPTSYVGHFRSAPATAPAGSVVIKNSVDRVYDRMQRKGKCKGQRRRVTLTAGLASARELSRSTRSFTAFVNDWSSSDSGPPPMIANSSSSSSPSGYETPPAGWVCILYILHYFQVHLSHLSVHALRILRNMIVPAPAAMTDPATAVDPMPSTPMAVSVDLSIVSRRHAPGRWAYSAETLAALNDATTATNIATGSKEKGKGLAKTKGHVKGNEFLTDTGSSSSAASAVLPHRQAADDIVGPSSQPQATEIIGRGPYWISHVRYIQLSNERTVADTGPLAIIAHDIGRCPSTGYFTTGTCLNDIEIDLLNQACVVLPNGASFGYYVRLQFRTLCTPPFARSAMLRYFNSIESQVAQEINDNPHFASGGPALRLSAIHARNKFAFDAYLSEAQEQFSS